jgi:PRTRC genetic system protein B
MTMSNKTETPVHGWAVPKELGIPTDPLRLRLDFHHQATVMTLFDGDITVRKLVDAADVAFALASDLSFGTGFLPENTLWWQNTRGGPVFAIYTPTKIRRLALQEDMKKAPRRFNIPLPPFVFLCKPGKPPWVFAVKKKPTKEKDMIYEAPLFNIYADGRSCPGSNKYPTRVADIVDSFFMSYFSHAADVHGRSRKFPKNVLGLWEYLDGKKNFPLEDLVEHGRIGDLMRMGMGD